MTITSSPLYPVKDENKKFGYVSAQGIWSIEPQFLEASEFINGYACVLLSDGNTYGTIDMSNSFAPFPLEYGIPSEAGYQNGILRIEIYNDTILQGPEKVNTYINTSNKILGENLQDVSPNRKNFKFEGARDFSEGRGAVQIDGLWGYIDIFGNIVIPPQFLNAFPFQNGSAVVVNEEGKIGLIDLQGNTLTDFFQIPSNATTMGDYYDGLYQVQLDNGKWNLVNEQGKYIFGINEFSYIKYNGYCWEVSKEANRGIYFSKVNKVVFSDFRTNPFTFYLNSVIIHKQGNDILCNLENGKKIYTAPKIDYSEGMACIQAPNGKYGYIDTHGQWVIAPEFDYAESFYNGVAFARSDGHTGLIFNPLIFQNGWSDNEIERAKLLGLIEEIEALDSNKLTSEECYNLVQALMVVQNGLIDRQASDLNKHISISESKFYELSRLSKGQFVDRQHFALILAEIAKLYGKSTECLYYPYNDAVDPEYLDAIAYCSILGVYEIAENQFLPSEQVTKQESVKMILRFFEAMQ